MMIGGEKVCADDATVSLAQRGKLCGIGRADAKQTCYRGGHDTCIDVADYALWFKVGREDENGSRGGSTALCGALLRA